MSTFNFKAKEGSGRTVSGSIEAASEQEVLGKLWREGRFALEVRQVAGRRWWDGELSLADED